MKKTLFLALCSAMSVTLVRAETTTPQSAPKFFMPAKPVQTPKIPTITAGWLDITDTITEFEKILVPLTQLVEDPTIDIIIIRINSTGGSPADSQIIADNIQSAKAFKPIIAFISRIGASGAYWIASACSYIICPAAAEVGSIGAASQYVFDKDKQYYYIASGIFKGPTINQHYEIDPQFLEQQKKTGMELAQIFAQNISTYRGIPTETILSWQAALFTGATAFKLGLVDQLGTMQDLLEKTVQLASEKNNTEYQQLKLVNTENTVIKTYQI